MNARNKRHAGATLIEVMLVIVIGSFIVYMSIQQYLSYRRDADVIQVQANVNAIFQAMSAFYRTNCYGSTDTTDPLNYSYSYGSLNPKNATPPGTNVPINIQTQLIDAKLMTDNIVYNPIVDDLGTAGTNGYVAQFNKSLGNKQVCVVGTSAAGPSDPACTTPKNIGEIVTWKAQVAVRLKNPSEAQALVKLLAGDCLSSESAGVVEPCSATSTGNYVVWERIPSSSTGAVSPYWETLPVVSQFTQMYTTNNILTLTDGSYTTDQYYLCGN